MIRELLLRRGLSGSLPADERQRWREAPDREMRIGISPLPFLGGRAVGGDEPGEALVEVVADGLAGRLEGRGRRLLDLPRENPLAPWRADPSARPSAVLQTNYPESDHVPPFGLSLVSTSIPLPGPTST
jgi:hypothetical protein